MSDPGDLRADLDALGYRLVQDRGTGILQYSLRQTSYLTYWVHWDVPNDSVLFTWEHAIGEYLSAIGLQVGANEPLNQFLFPKYDARGPVDIAFVVQEMDRVEQVLRAVNFLDGAT